MKSLNLLKRIFLSILLCGLALGVAYTQSLTLSFDADNAICGGLNGQAFVEATGGNPPYFYIWSNGLQTDTIMNLQEGTYTVTVTDITGVTASGSVDVDNDNFNININFNSSSAGCGSSDGSLQAIATAGTAPYSYLWNNGLTTSALTNINAGAYTVTVTDVNGCTAVSSGAVSNTGAPTLSLNTQASTCFNTQDGSATVSVSGGNPPYGYSWSTGNSSPSINNVSGGNYPLTVSDASGCLAVSIVTIPSPTELIADVFPVQAACGGMGGKARIQGLGGTPPYTYLWATGDTVEQIGGLVAGLYMASVTDANGCTDWGITNINTEPPPASVISSTNASCSGKEDGGADLTVLAGQPPFVYQWSNGDATEDLSNISSGVYSVTLTDANSCSNTNTVMIGADKELTLDFDVTQVSSADANDGSVTVQPGGGNQPYTYSWSDGTTGPTLSNVSQGIYAVTVVDADGCWKADSVGVFIVGLGNEDRAAYFGVFPNPASHTIFVEIHAETNSFLEWRITNSLGQEMVRRGVYPSNSTVREHVEISGFAPGVYCIDLMKDDRLQGRSRFVKMR